MHTLGSEFSVGANKLELRTSNFVASKHSPLSQYRVAINVENMENLENSADWKNCQNFMENSEKFEILWKKTCKTEGKHKYVQPNPINLSLFICPGKNLKTT